MPCPCLLYTSICAWLDFGKKETIAFRADMDGLPIAERTSKPYASRHTGKMHACGHDGHMSMILALAERIESHREALSRNVMLIFQPAEETEGGAESIVESGILDVYKRQAMKSIKPTATKSSPCWD